MLKAHLFNHTFMILLIAISGLISAQTAEASDDIPHLVQNGDAAQLIVDGKPFLILGGELHNSSASNLNYLKPIWPKLVQMNLNTLLAPVYWELIEPNKGEFDFSLVDGLIEGARENKLRLVILWFGSWKNSMSCYAPQWVKTDQQRFPRVKTKSGKTLEILSPFNSENCDADAHAFAALMTHIHKIDNQQHTVIMVQVENEIGMLEDARDYSDTANQVFNQLVPKELIEYMTKYKTSLMPELNEIWAKGGYKTKGSWQEVFGQSLQTDEIFMAWHYAKYVNAVTSEGKAEYSLPMFVNAALIRPGYKPGQYPSAGPLPHLMDIWRAAAPNIDFLSPDIYFPNFAEWCEKYHQSNNPLFIPEAKNDSDAVAKAFFAIGKYNAIGFSPFGIDSTQESDSNLIAQGYDVLAQLSPLVLEKQGQGLIAGVLLDKENQTTQLKLGGYTLNVSHDYTFKWSSGPKDADIWPQAGGVIISTAPDEFIVVGCGFIVTFELDTPDNSTVGIISVQQGRYQDEVWLGGRWLNGDENHQGRHVRLPFGQYGIQRVKLYTYK